VAKDFAESASVLTRMVGRVIATAEAGDDGTIVLTATDGVRIGFAAESGGLPYVAPIELESDEQMRRVHQERQQILTCVYCGQEYPPGTPRSNHQLLTEHVRHCPQHPMKKAFDLLDAVQAHLQHEKESSGYDSHERDRLLGEVKFLLR
jgi:hypothetical protein